MNDNSLLVKIKENYNYLKSLGYKDEDIIKMTLIYPGIYVRNIDKLNSIIEYFKSLNYELKDIYKMIYIHPQLFSYSIDNINNKIEGLINI